MRIITVLALLVVAVSAVPRNPSRIIGGSLTTIDKYPSNAALLYSETMTNFRWFCGGTIINNRSVLSAAHCIEIDPVETVRVRIGSSFASSGGEVLPLSAIIIHPEYNINREYNDVTILRTSVEIIYSNTVQQAVIAGPNYIIADNEVVWATGWGTTEDAEPSEQLRDVQVWTINQETCRRRYLLTLNLITSNMLCTSSLIPENRGQCWGDSAGAALFTTTMSLLVSALFKWIALLACFLWLICVSPTTPRGSKRTPKTCVWYSNMHLQGQS